MPEPPKAHDGTGPWPIAHSLLPRGRRAAEKSGAKDAAALLSGGQDKLRAVAQAARKIDPASREVLNEVLGNLVGIAARRVGKDMAEALFGWRG